MLSSSTEGAGLLLRDYHTVVSAPKLSQVSSMETEQEDEETVCDCSPYPEEPSSAKLPPLQAQLCCERAELEAWLA